MVHVYTSNSDYDNRWRVGKQVATWLFILAVIGAIAFTGYSFYKTLKSPMVSAFDIIPEGAAIIFSLNDWEEINQSLSNDTNGIIAAIKKQPLLGSYLQYIQQINTL